MEEKELISKIQKLRQIKPDQDWVVLTKSQILGEEKKCTSLFLFPFLKVKPVYAGLVVIFILFGLFGMAQNSLPGDLLYPIKKITEKSQAVFISEEELPKYNLEIANKRLEELNKIAQTNQVKKLTPAISEFQSSVSQAGQKLTETKKPKVKEIVEVTKKIEENKQKVESRGIEVGETTELDKALLQLIERQLKDLQVRSLTDSQKQIFLEAVEDFKAGKYADTLYKIWLLTNPQ